MDLLTRLTIIYSDKYLHRQVFACLVVLNDVVMMTNMTIYAFQPQFFNPLKHQVGHPNFEFLKLLFPIFFIENGSIKSYQTTTLDFKRAL